MKVKLFLFLLLTAAIPALAQTASVTGSVVEADTGNPVIGAFVTLHPQGVTVNTGLDGRFTVNNTAPGQTVISISSLGFADKSVTADLVNGKNVDLGFIGLDNEDLNTVYYEESQDMWFDENALDDEEGSAQSITALTGASDDIYYNASNYNFQPMYFRYRGYDSMYQTVSINGIVFNDLGRGRFNFSMLGGMTSRAFRNRSAAIGLAASTYGFGDIGGSVNYNTVTSSYSPGFNGSLAYTNSNYMFRAMATYSTGINKNGWGLTVCGIGRYADEGIVEGTFYNSFGAFLSLEKVFNDHHSLTLTAFGAPTQRATSSASYQEIYDMLDNNLYNPNWGWYDGKKRSAKIVEQFDPTAMLNWIYKDKKVTVNTGIAAHLGYYSTSALSWNNAADPRCDYYSKLPSYFYDDGEPTPESDLVKYYWTHDQSVSQINWDNLYWANHLTNYYNEHLTEAQIAAGEKRSASYILENRVSKQMMYLFNSDINYRLNPNMTLQGGVSLNYTVGDYYKTIRDMLGGEFWYDTDSRAEIDYPGNEDLRQNDLNHPNREVRKGDKFGYNYTMYALQATAWLQNIITLPQWDINYGLKIGYTTFQREGHMRNGRAPENSYGKGKTHKFDTGAIKVGATYKIDGRNFISAHGQYETRAPLYENAYISPRIKDTAIEGLTNERILSGDISYIWNYRKFRGGITAFRTEMFNMNEKFSYYDDLYGTNMNYVLTGVHRRYKGVEVGMSYKVTPSITATLAATYSQYQYKNRPMGTRSYENGMSPDTTQVVYLKNFYVGGTPQTAVNFGIDWAAPHRWFFNVNASWMGNAYVSLTPIRHEALPDLWTKYPDAEELEAKMRTLCQQDKLNDAFVLNASVGKLIYLRKITLNINLSASNLLNNRKIMTNGFQQGRFDYTNFNPDKFANKYQYAQGIRLFLNVGVRF